MDRETKWERAIEKAEERERRVRRRAVALWIIPVVLVVGLIWLTIAKMRDAKDIVTEVRHEWAHAQQTVDSLLAQQKELAQLLEESAHVARYAVEVDSATVREIATAHRIQGKVLSAILDLRKRDLRWKLGGKTEEDGFDSSGFAVYVLRMFELLPGEYRMSDSRRLREYFAKIDRTELGQGDLIFYSSGYTMFYFRSDRKEFCIGMTPVGIVALDVDFGPEIVEFGRVPYRGP